MMDLPTFASVPAQVLMKNTLGFCHGNDILNIRQVFWLSNLTIVGEYQDELERLIVPYDVVVFVGAFLDMLRAALVSGDRKRRNVGFMIEYRDVMEIHDNAGQLINPHNDRLENVLLCFFYCYHVYYSHFSILY